MSDFLTVSEKASRAAGEVLMSWRGKFNVREKGRADLVTEADLAAQKAIEETLFSTFPDFNFLGEESTDRNNGSLNPDCPYCWIVDPLDGTTNYVHGLPNYSVSIALANAGEIEIGIVYDPVFDRCFKAEKGKGAWLNDEPLKVSTAETFDEALVAASFAPNVQPDSPEIQQFISVVTKCRGIRRLGSAALNLAYVAAGNLDGYWAGQVKAWDVAAGVLLVQEAGGVVKGFDSAPFQLDQPKVVASGTEALQSAMQAEIAKK